MIYSKVCAHRERLVERCRKPVNEFLGNILCTHHLVPIPLKKYTVYLSIAGGTSIPRHGWLARRENVLTPIYSILL